MSCTTDGILVLDKPSGPTSNFVLQKVKRAIGSRKAGFTGTLDPLATGVLPICLGEATKIARFLTEFDKCYRAKMRLGVRTSTGDCEGEVLHALPVRVDWADLEALLPRFVGVIQQQPPMYSAVKYKGKPLYHYARQGVVIERKTRAVEIKSLELLTVDESVVEFVVECTKGTYIRSLAEDIGEALGCGGHLIELERLSVGPFSLNDSVVLDGLIDGSIQAQTLLDKILPLERGVAHLPDVLLSEDQCKKVSFGQSLTGQNSAALGWVALVRERDQRLVGIGERDINGKIWPKRLIQS